MFANNIDQEWEKRCIGKKSDQIKEPSRVVIEDSQSTCIVPEPSDYVAAIHCLVLYLFAIYHKNLITDIQVC